MSYPPMITIPNNPSLKGMARIDQGLVYSKEHSQKLTLLRPWFIQNEPLPKRPLIIFLQGSAWTSPDLDYEIPQLGRYAQEGYVVATISHRDSSAGHPFPAYLEDAKTAIRFLKANAEVLGIDPQRVAMFGTSSGGNTALLVGLTADDPRYKTQEFSEYSDAVNTVIACFAPSDMSAMVEGQFEMMAEHPAFMGLIGKQKPQDVARGMSPILEIKHGKDYPTFMLAHGDADELVSFSQSVSMYHALLDAGCRARMIRVVGAPHEDNFWSGRLHGLLSDYLKETL